MSATKYWKKITVLQSLEKVLKSWFVNYFQFSNNADLDFIRETTELKALVEKYFSEEEQRES